MRGGRAFACRNLGESARDPRLDGIVSQVGRVFVRPRRKLSKIALVAQRSQVTGGSLHLGLTPWLATEDMTSAGLAAQALQAEEMGFDSFWLPESHFEGPYGGRALPEPLLLLAAAATVTKRLRLGTTSYLLSIRNPLQAAEQVATLDILSAGRLILGIGRGFRDSLFRAFAIDPKRKRQTFECNLRVMRRAWSGAPVALGANARNIRLSPLPWQKPHPPLWMAAFGVQALRQAGRLGLPYLAAPMSSMARLQQNLHIHRQALMEAGMSPPAEVPLMRTVFVSVNTGALAAVREALRQSAAAMARSRPAVLGLTEDVNGWALVGRPNEVADGIEGYRERFGMTHLIATRLPVMGSELPNRRLLEKSLALLRELSPR